jgi:hypothetical protein
LPQGWDAASCGSLLADLFEHVAGVARAVLDRLVVNVNA